MTARARARRRLLAGALLCGVLAPAPLTGCAESVDPIERLGRKAAQKVPRSPDRGVAGPVACVGDRAAVRPPWLPRAEPAPPAVRCPEGVLRTPSD
ncbi:MULTISPECIES: hypothetical protein [unclassified Streptomyces]|uniref:hypothetical protein n=1 Tax=unclassified Streptomyces TaxID=2593676 RepID=UPI001EEFAEDF|nr:MULTISPECIES: hypothetical protein [unclassified Streptomyces]